MFLNYVSNFGLVISALIVLAATVWGKIIISLLDQFRRLISNYNISIIPAVFVFCFPQRQKSVDPNATRKFPANLRLFNLIIHIPIFSLFLSTVLFSPFKADNNLSGYQGGAAGGARLNANPFASPAHRGGGPAANMASPASPYVGPGK